MIRHGSPGRLAHHSGFIWPIVLAALLLALAGCDRVASPAADAPVVEPAAGADRLVVAWVDGADLSTWETGGAARVIAAGSAGRPQLNPAGTQVAFTRGPDGRAASLWVIGVTGDGERELAGPEQLNAYNEWADATQQINQVSWLDDDTLLFNTLFVMIVPAPGGSKVDDLWRADLDTGQVTRMLPDDQGGDFAISPDGSHIALVTPGGYAGLPGQVRLVDSQGQAETHLLTFTAPATASEYLFYPQLHWLPDSSALLTAIPDPDLVYPTAPGETPRTAALWRLEVTGESRQIGRVPASFFGLPRWSPAGGWLTYLAQVGRPEDNTVALVLAQGDGTQPEQLVTGAVGALEAAAWHPTEDFFTYTAGGPGERWLARPGTAASRFLPGGNLVYALAWADADTAVITGVFDGAAALWIVDLDRPSPTRIGPVGEGFVSISIRRLH